MPNLSWNSAHEDGTFPGSLSPASLSSSQVRRLLPSALYSLPIAFCFLNSALNLAGYLWLRSLFEKWSQCTRFLEEKGSRWQVAQLHLHIRFLQRATSTQHSGMGGVMGIFYGPKCCLWTTGKELDLDLGQLYQALGVGVGDAVLLEEKFWSTLHSFLSREGWGQRPHLSYSSQNAWYQAL